MLAAVLGEIGKPLRVMDLEMPNSGEVDFEKLVRLKMLTSGICGAQLQEIDGKKGNPLHCPHLLGHEGCGIIWGTNQKVVIHWKKGDGPDVSSVGVFGDVKAGPCTTFSESTFVARNRVTPIPPDVPYDLACLLGCCLSTALATVENVARIQVSESVLVIGAGGVGLSMILAARIAGAHVVSTDSVYSKWKLAKAIGAERFFPSYTEFHWSDFSGNTDHSYCGPIWPPHEADHRFDVIIDTVGKLSRANLLANGGRYIMVGQPLPEMTLQPFTAGWIFQGNGGRIEATNGGGFNPTKDIPRYVQMWREGKLDDYKKIITHRIKLDEINQGISLMRDGKAGRVLIEM